MTNPHDPEDRPGAHLVSAQFGVTNPWKLTENFAPTDPRDLAGRAVAEAARNLDVLHGQLKNAATKATELMKPIMMGSPTHVHGGNGALVLGELGPRIELLAARRGAAYDQLTNAMQLYMRVEVGQSTDPSAQKTVVPATPHVTEAAGHDTAPLSPDTSIGSTAAPDYSAKASPDLVSLLEAIEGGEVRRIRDWTHGTVEFTDRGQPAGPEFSTPRTVQRLMDEGLIADDTSTHILSPDGRLLSLTPQGEAALRVARTAKPRVTAALSRSTSPVKPRPTAAAPAAPPVAGTAKSSSRSR